MLRDVWAGSCPYIGHCIVTEGRVGVGVRVRVGVTVIVGVLVGVGVSVGLEPVDAK